MSPYTVAAEIAQFVKCDSLGTQAAEVWIVNLAAAELEVNRSPIGDSYVSVARAGRSDTLMIQAIPDVRIPVGRIFE